MKKFLIALAMILAPAFAAATLNGTVLCAGQNGGNYCMAAVAAFNNGNYPAANSNTQNALTYLGGLTYMTAMAQAGCGGSPSGSLGALCSTLGGGGFFYVPPPPSRSVIASAVAFTDQRKDVVYVGFAIISLLLVGIAFVVILGLVNGTKNFGGKVGGKVHDDGYDILRSYTHGEF